MIVRLMGEGQYRIDEAAHTELDAKLDEMWSLVRTRGERLPDDDLSASDLIVPPSDLTLAETRELFSEQGLIPDLPA